MDNLSAQQKLMGNMQATSAELLSGIMEERGRGFASDREAWAQLKENIENVESRMKAIKDVHKDMWSAVKDHNGDAFCALAGEFQRSAILWPWSGRMPACWQTSRCCTGRTNDDKK